MLTRNSQVGEFYVLQPPQVKPEPGKEKFTCDILIYDEESDRHVRVTWAQALKACCIGTGIDDTKEMSHPTGKMRATSAAGAAITPDAEGNYTADQKKAQATLANWKAKADEWTRFNNGETIDYKTLDTDIRIVIARPFIEHLMHSVVMAVSGRDTGATLFGPADMQLSANTQVKTIEGCDCMFEPTHTHTHTHLIAVPFPGTTRGTSRRW